MVEPRLLADALVDLASAGVYELAGLRLARAHARGAGRGASTAFSVWWHALAVTGALAAVQSSIVAFGVTDLTLLKTLEYVLAATFTVGLAGLSYYFVYLYTGRRTLLAPIVVVYVAYNLLSLANFIVAPPTSLEIRGWRGTLVPQPAPAFLVLTFVLVLVPPAAGALAYFALVFRVEDPTARYRIALVSGSILAWLVAALVVSQPALTGSDAAQAAARVVSLLSALVLLLAYRPPRFVRERWGVAALAPHAQAKPPSELETSRKARSEALGRRIQDLV